MAIIRRDWVVKPAKMEHIEQIVSICEESKDFNPNYGYSVLGYMPVAVAAGLKNFYVALDEKERVGAYMSLFQTPPMETKDVAEWTSKKIKLEYEENLPQFIEQIHVSTKYSRTGGGDALYEYLFSKNPTVWYCALIASAPVTNFEANIFHSKEGFKPCAIVRFNEKTLECSTLWIRKPRQSN